MVVNDQHTGDSWSENEFELHINKLELIEILHGLSSLLEHINCAYVLVKCDNVIATVFINNIGGCRSLSCHDIAQNIWKWVSEYLVDFSGVL